MTQQQNHNTNGVYPFDWQLDPVHWLFCHEAAPFEPVYQPEGEYFHSYLPPFDLSPPVETVCNPWCMALGHYCPQQPRGILNDVPKFPYAGPAPGAYLDPIVCYGPPFEYPPEVIIGCPGMPPQPEQPGQEYCSPYGPPRPYPPPMAVPFWQPPPPPFPPVHPPFGPEDMIPGPRQPGWFLEDLPPCPDAESALRTMHWVTYCAYQRPCNPAEGPVTPGAIFAHGEPLSPEQPEDSEGGHWPLSPLSVPHAGARVPGGWEVRMRRYSW